jgi:hypothetical protein
MSGLHTVPRECRVSQREMAPKRFKRFDHRTEKPLPNCRGPHVGWHERPDNETCHALAHSGNEADVDNKIDGRPRSPVRRSRSVRGERRDQGRVGSSMTHAAPQSPNDAPLTDARAQKTRPHRNARWRCARRCEATTTRSRFSFVAVCGAALPDGTRRAFRFRTRPPSSPTTMRRSSATAQRAGVRRTRRWRWHGGVRAVIRSSSSLANRIEWSLTRWRPLGRRRRTPRPVTQKPPIATVFRAELQAGARDSS